jgi:transposase
MERAKNKDTRRKPSLKQEWQRHIKAWRASGDTQVSYCRKHGLSRHAFQYWKHNLQGSRHNRFVELSRTTGAGSGDVVEILINGRVQIRVPQGVSPEHLHMVLQTVKEL